mmetsp:Transcript_97130/g.258105  ORF Transcript_97130/g.258105 Transcript_97130/m.258105 type:complete len:252 (+) Transcript_97130:116-871(+)
MRRRHAGGGGGPWESSARKTIRELLHPEKGRQRGGKGLRDGQGVLEVEGEGVRADLAVLADHGLMVRVPPKLRGVLPSQLEVLCGGHNLSPLEVHDQALRLPAPLRGLRGQPQLLSKRSGGSVDVHAEVDAVADALPGVLDAKHLLLLLLARGLRALGRGQVVALVLQEPPVRLRRVPSQGERRPVGVVEVAGPAGGVVEEELDALPALADLGVHQELPLVAVQAVLEPVVRAGHPELPEARALWQRLRVA